MAAFTFFLDTLVIFLGIGKHWQGQANSLCSTGPLINITIMRTHFLLGGAGAIAMSTAASAKVLPRQSDPGVNLANMGSSEQTFYFCDNASNGDGTADPGFTDGTSGCSNLVTSVAVQPSAVRPCPALPSLLHPSSSVS